MNIIVKCRTCRRLCSDYKSLFEQNYFQKDVNTLADLLQYCINLTYPPEESDGLPQHICLLCLKSLEHSYNIKRIALESDHLLRQGLQEVNKDFLMNEMTDFVGGIKDTDDDIKKENSEIFETLSEIDVEFVKVENYVAAAAIEVVTDGYIEVAETENTKFIKEEVSQESVELIEYDEETEQHLEKFEIDEVVTEIELDPGYILYEEVCEKGYAEEADGGNDGAGEGGDGDGNTITDATMQIEVSNKNCDICGKGFQQECHLRLHMQAHINEKPYTCEVCGKKLKNENTFKKHVLGHTELKPHQCDTCGKFYRTTSILATHKRVHAEDKPFKCDMCGRGFIDLAHIQRHQLTHTGHRPHACNLCDKAYYDLSSLRTHMNSHNGIKAFTCEICGIGLTQKSGYNKHMLVHSGKKPHQCPICGRCFAFTSNLNSHIHLHSGKKPFKCDKCPKCFPTKCGLKSHQRVHISI